MRLYDTAQRSIVDLDVGPDVGMYVCGITPYDSTHLGHAATYLAYDLVVRRLESLGNSVELVRNFTDVDDSILPKAAELGEHYLTLAEREMSRFADDMTALGTRPPAHEPRATQSIDEIVDAIGRLDAAGHAYSADGVTYFDVATFPRFGRLSGLDHESMVNLARARGGSPDNPAQRNPLDFVLWQPSAPGEPSWESPFGPGRPGWHIECSAMGSAAFGATVDIHGGGGDLVFPHHENERAEALGCDRAFARHWVHNGMVQVDGEKMSKSVGNLVFVSDLRREVDPRAIRLAVMAHHYRDDWEWFDDEAAVAQRDLERMLDAARAGDGPRAAG
ncbi:MAG TPA: cysteine--tRNA ligase, partial [Acidimicrobiaceae bacterium]|nr:cysteine--tRNA ligase [Acidimicrobiaceae bacterium]